MAIVLKRLKSVGPDREDAVLEFGEKRTLIRGPSDTGKSYIRDCLWFLLGGDKVPKKFPLAEGYQELQLRFESEGFEYEVRREADGLVLATGHTVHACVGPGGKPTGLPQTVVKLLAP